MELGPLGPFTPLAPLALVVFGGLVGVVRVGLAILAVSSLVSGGSTRERLVLAIAQALLSIASMVAGVDGGLGMPGMRALNLLQLSLGLALLATAAVRARVAR